MRAVSIALSVIAVALSGSLAGAGGRRASCYERVAVPAVYDTVQEQVLIEPARQVVQRIEPVFERAVEQVVIRPVGISYRQIAPVYDVVQRQVLVQPARVAWEERWINGRQILCKIKYPAVYDMVSERVLVREGQSIAIETPAVYGTRERTVMVRAGGQRIVTVPARYGVVSRQVLVRPATTVWQPVDVGCR